MVASQTTKHSMAECSTLFSSRDFLSRQPFDAQVADRVEVILRRWQAESGSIEPYLAMQEVLESVRRFPAGEDRLYGMLAILKTLGQPEALATFLDALRESVSRSGTQEQEMSRARLLSVRMHSIYGWCGNTLMVESLNHPTEGTFPAPDGLAERLGNSAAAWNLTIHIWQPNTVAKGFPASGRITPGVILEPPHSHPFDFISTVVKGEMHQSIYAVRDDDNIRGEGYYADVPLQYVDGVWPPHNVRETVALNTLEHRVRLQAGDIYYMPCHWIHDVEIDARRAATQPSITLFLSSEYMVMPRVYMTDAMADFHEVHADIKLHARPIAEDAWHRKLRAISSYLRGEQHTLNLNEIVMHEHDYAFFHLNR